ISPRYLASMAGAYTLVDDDATSEEVSQGLKLMLSNITKPGNKNANEAFQILGLDPREMQDLTGEEILRAMQESMKENPINDAQMNAIATALSTNNLGVARTLVPRVASMLEAMQKDEFGRM